MKTVYRLFLILACLAFTGAAFAAPTDTSADADSAKTEKVTITAGANGSAPLAFLWEKAPLNAPANFTALPAETQTSIVLSPVTPGIAGVYRAKISNQYGTTYTPTATVRVVSSPTVESFTVTVTQKQP